MNFKKICWEIIFSTKVRQLWWRYEYVRQFHKDKEQTMAKLVRLGDADPKKTLRKMWWASAFHLWLPDEYMAYHYELLSRKGRHQYVLNWEKTEFCEKVNPKSCWNLLNDKYASYEYFKPFYKREAILLQFNDKECEIALLEDFFSRNESAIVKPLSEGSGKGIKKFTKADYKSILVLYSAYKSCIVEEVVIQDLRMACLHPQSINTLRMSVIRKNSGIELLRPFMRIGQGGSIVDNGGAGGILAAIDVETGIIKSAATEDGTEYVVHPDTHIPIVGFQIPLWKEAIAFTAQLMEQLPEGTYMSWDLALSDKGWIMIEGNVQGQFFGQQIPTHSGLRSDFDKYKKLLRK